MFPVWTLRPDSLFTFWSAEKQKQDIYLSARTHNAFILKQIRKLIFADMFINSAGIINPTG